MSSSVFWILVFAVSLAAIFIILNRVVAKVKGSSRPAHVFRRSRIGRSEKREIDAIDIKRGLQIYIQDFVKLEEKVAEAELKNILLRFVTFLERRSFHIQRAK